MRRQKIARQAAEWAQELSLLQEKTKSSFAKIDAAIQGMAAADADLQNKLKILNDSKFNPVLAPDLKTAYAKSTSFENYLNQHKDDEDKCTAYKTNLGNGSDLAGRVQAELTSPATMSPADGRRDSALRDEMDGIHANDHPAQSASAPPRWRKRPTGRRRMQPHCPAKSIRQSTSWHIRYRSC